MHIALDGRPLTGQIRGIGIYTNGLVQHLPSLAPQHRFTLLTDKPLSVTVPPAWTILKVPALSQTWWEMVQIPSVIKRERVDLLHGTNHFQVPMHHVCPMVITVHDLAAWLFPDTVSQKFHWLFKTRLRRAAAIADHVICVSQSTAQDLHQLLPFTKTKTTVTHEGVDGMFRPLNSELLPLNAKLPHGIHRPYILSVSALEPRKNIATLIKAFEMLQRQGLTQYQLVLVGQPWLRAEPLYALAQRVPNVVFTGHVPPEGLVELYQQAEVFAYPSWYEGFGLPPLEAMACGTPVITSHGSCFPEVLGEAARFVSDSKNPEAWANAIHSLLNNAKERPTLIERGLDRVTRYDWNTMAQKTLTIYERVLASRN